MARDEKDEKNEQQLEQAIREARDELRRERPAAAERAIGREDACAIWKRWRRVVRRLIERLKKGPPPWPTVAEILEELAALLDAICGEE